MLKAHSSLVLTSYLCRGQTLQLSFDECLYLTNIFLPILTLSICYTCKYQTMRKTFSNSKHSSLLKTIVCLPQAFLSNLTFVCFHTYQTTPKSLPRPTLQLSFDECLSLANIFCLLIHLRSNIRQTIRKTCPIQNTLAQFCWVFVTHNHFLPLLRIACLNIKRQ